MEESFAAQIVAYHEASKHHYRTYAPGPGYLDWATQPNPFRRYDGAQVIPLARPMPDDDLPYEAGFTPGLAPVAPFDAVSVSRLFFDTLAISAWKAVRRRAVGVARQPVQRQSASDRGLSDLRRAPWAERARCADGRALCPGRAQPGGAGAVDPAHLAGAARGHCANRGDGLPEETIFVGLTSILWREAWKYGDRAFRYCQHDVGHALGALGIAAAGLGWQARLLDDLGVGQLETLLGVTDPRGAEPEHPDCLVAVFPQRAHFQQWKLAEGILDYFRPIAWQGQPNVLSPSTSSGAGPRRRRRSCGSRRGRGRGRDRTGIRRQGVRDPTRMHDQESGARKHQLHCAASSISGGARGRWTGRR